MTKDLMGKAETALASARLLLEAQDSDGATNRAYYAMFDAATAALEWAGTVGTPPKTLAELITSFGRTLVQTGRVPTEFGRSLNRVHELRLTGDYLAEPIPLEKAKQAIAEAEAFVAAVRALLSQSPT